GMTGNIVNKSIVPFPSRFYYTICIHFNIKQHKFVMQFRITSQLANVFSHYSYVTGSNVIKRKGVKMKKSESDDCVVAGTAEELLDALKLKADYILITKYYKREFLDKTELPLPEMGFFSGTR